MTFDLDRFTRAQERDYEQALAELRAGRKRTHWIWYVFPQLAGLGNSPAAQTYGLQGVDEATEYLRNSVLRGRLFDAANAVRAHVERQPPATLQTLMGSEIDVLKLVSSMTLFRAVARRIGDEEIASVAHAILRAGRGQGFPECEFTKKHIAAAS
ncbi:MAG TPA: DUF1810 family protein [Vicinamibacterales bacterium]|nr:DUF1810 family protein [Vicinamibacterales bacterium]